MSDDATIYSKIFPHTSRGRFKNYRNEDCGDSLLQSIVMYVQSLFVRHGDKKNIKNWHAPSIVQKRSHAPLITWLGHSTFLIQCGGKNILTDPVFGNLTFLFPRILPPGLAVSQLPPIDYVLISHNHRDHLDGPSLILLKTRFPDLAILVPQGDKQWFTRRGFTRVSEHMWWDRMETSEITFTFLPALHWSQRGVFDRNKSLWGSWMIEAEDVCVYFAGDTAYDDHFKRISYYFPHIDATLMPIGPCEPRSWMHRTHVDAQEAGQAFLDLKSNYFFPMHWGTFYFGTDTFLDPVDRLRDWWQKNQKVLVAKELVLQKLGEAKAISRTIITHKKPKIIQP